MSALKKDISVANTHIAKIKEYSQRKVLSPSKSIFGPSLSKLNASSTMTLKKP
jgi:hypothetical protein